MQNQAPSMLMPALLAGAVFGFAANIPFINCLCCLLVIGCGFLAAFLYSRKCQEAGVRFGAGNGAMVGLISGFFYAVVSTVIGSVVRLVFGLGDPRQILEQLQQSGLDMDPQILDQVTNFMETTGPFALILIAFVVTLVFGAIFATLGGVIGGAVFKVEARTYGDTQAPPPPQMPPPPPV